MESYVRGSTPQKSILKPKAKSSSNPLTSSSSTPTKSSSRKKVEITTPPHSVKSEELHLQEEMKYFRETPIPRVAFLAKSPLVQPKPKTAKKSSKKPSKRHISAASDKGFRTKGTTTKKKKSSKKLKSKSKSASEIPPKEVAADAGRQYMKELGTIKEILKSVTDPSTHLGHESELIDGFVRPFSAVELQQLLQSIGNVATIHHHIPGGSEAAEAVVKGMTGSRSSISNSQSQSLKKESIPKFQPGNVNKSRPSPTATASMPAISKTKMTKSSKSKKSTKVPSTSKANRNAKTSSKIINKKLTPPKNPTSGMSKPVASAKSAKPSVKSLYQPLNLKPKASKKKTKKKGSKTGERRSSDSVLSELSELDLVKSALLNKRYYEESMALERRASKDGTTPKKQSSSKKRNKPREEPTSNPSSKQSSTDEFIETLSPISSLIASSMSSKSESSSHQEPTTLKGLKTLEETLGAISRHKTFDSNPKPSTKDVLINHSHVIRDPELRNVSFKSTLERQNNRGFANPRPLPFKMELADLDDVQGFDKHLQKIKYPGIIPVVQGLLDIPPPITKLVANATELTGKYLRNERILEETRSKAISGSGSLIRKDILKPNPVEVIKEKRKTSAKPRSKGKFSKVHKKSIPPPSSVFEGKKHLEPTVENLTKIPSKWDDNSISASRFQLAKEGGSRWADLNLKTVQKTREIKTRSLGRRREIPKDDLDAIRRTLESSDERNKYLENIVKARANFDTYNAYYDTKDQEATNNRLEPSVFQKI